MVDPNSSACPDPASGPVDGADGADGAESTRPEDESTPHHHPAADAAGEHTAGAGLSPHLTTDEIFEEMVAGLELGDGELEAGARDAAGLGPKSSTAPWAFPVAPWVKSAGPRDRVVTPDVADLEELELHFVPPEPSDVLSKDPLVNLAWAAVLAAPLLVIATLLFWPAAPGIVVPLSGVVFIAGLAALVWRMPATRDPSDDGPGAVV